MNGDEEEIQALIRSVVEATGLPQAQIARDSGISYAALHAWVHGLRSPRTRSLLQLADGLESRSDTLRELAQQLRAAAAAKE